MNIQHKESISLTDNVILSPSDKYAKYGRFPCKLTVHIFLLASLTILAILHTKNTSTYNRTLYTQFYYMFFAQDDRYTAIDYTNKRLIFTYDDFRSTIMHALVVLS